MKKDIHPTYYSECKIFVGGEFIGTTGSTRPELHLDVWSGTHPYYTGQQRILDTEGQVDRFTKRLERRASDITDKQAKQAKRRAKRQIAEIVDDEPAATDAAAAAE